MAKAHQGEVAQAHKGEPKNLIGKNQQPTRFEAKPRSSQTLSEIAPHSQDAPFAWIVSSYGW